MKRFLCLIVFLCLFPEKTQHPGFLLINNNEIILNMADINKLVSILLKWEGGFVNDPVDKGGATNMGVTIDTWKRVGYDVDGDGDIDIDDLIQLNKEQVVIDVLKPHYWNKWQADNINNQSIANLVVDWTWGSGVWGIKHPQRVLGVKVDGIVGPKTLAAVNDYPDQKELFEKLWLRRKKHFEDIVEKDPTQKRFIKGWLNRLNDFKYTEK